MLTSGPVSATGVADSVVIPLDNETLPMTSSLFLAVTGTVTTTVQYTGDDVLAVGFSAGSATWYPHPAMTGLTANGADNLLFPAKGVRLHNTAGTGTATLKVIQSGPSS
jgi:hypothetical protein